MGREVDAPARIDGRTARAERTRRAIVDAHLALLDEGDLKPTGERIAERAGVSLRALWANFKDMETLFTATARRLGERLEEAYQPVPVDLPLQRRVEEFCRQRARMLELLGPAARAASLREPFSAALRRNRTRELNRVRAELSDLFAHELQAAGPGREQLLHALVVSTTFSAWAVLRDQFGLGVAAARGVMTRMVTALLAAALAASLP